LLHPVAENSLRELGVEDGQITQTVGNAPASKGFHAAEGHIDGHDYSSCVDLSYSLASRAFQERMVEGGWAPFPRDYGSFSSNRHIHAVFIGLRDDRGQCRILPGPRQQIVDATRNRNGLVGHAPLPVKWRFTETQREAMLKAYRAWVPDIATGVWLEGWKRIRCYAWLEQHVARCDVRSLLEALGAEVVYNGGDTLITAKRDGKILDLSHADLSLEGGQFTRGNVRQLAKACGYEVGFEWLNKGAAAKITLKGSTQ